MASTDATALPIKNQAYRVTFPIFDADGDLVTGATGLDSEISKDAGTFADCTNEATEIATASGMYYLDLTSTEMNADTVAIIVKTSSVGAKTTPIVMYPAESTDISVNVAAISGDVTAADNAESFFDGTGYAGTNNVIPLVTTTTTATNVTTVNGLAANVITATSIASDAITAAKIADGAIDANTFASGAITATAIAADAITAAKIADGAIDAATFAAGAIDASAIAANAIGSSELATSAVDEIVDAVWDELASGHVAAGSYGQALNIVRANTAQAGAATTITLDASASAVNGFYNNTIIFITGGTGVGQSRIISDYVGATKVASVPAWITNPSSDSVFVILPFGAIPGATAPTAAEVADAVWDEARSGHVAGGSFGEYTLADVVKISGDTTSADNLESYTDGTTPMPVNATQLSGDATAADNAESFFDGTGYAGTNNVIPTVTTSTNVTTVNGLAAGVITATSIAADAITAAKIADGSIDAATFAAGAINAAAIATDAITAAKIAADAIGASELAADAVTEIQSGLATAANLTTLTNYVDTEVAAIKAVTDALPNSGALTTIQSDLDDIQTRLPAALVSGRMDSNVQAMATGVITATVIAADAIGASELAADAVTEIQSGLATAAALTTVAGYIDTEVAAIKAVTDNLPNSGALTNLDAAISTRATPAQVNTEVLDVLTVDTFAEPSAVPAATSTLKDKLNWLFALARNKRTTTATTDTLRNDADNGNIATAGVADDGSTFTRNEYS